jgi:hypothetical protein
MDFDFIFVWRRDWCLKLLIFVAARLEVGWLLTEYMVMPRF